MRLAPIRSRWDPTAHRPPTWNVSDAESPVVHPSGCDAAAISAPATHLQRDLISVPGVPGKAAAVAELRVSKRVPAGTARLRLRLTPKAKSLLRGAAMATLKITVSGHSSLAKPASVERRLVVRR